jgi:predicted dehydrogenase
MAINQVTIKPSKTVRIGMLGCGFMGKCHSNAYKKIPYIYPASGFATSLAVLCDQRADVVEREAARYGYAAYCTDWKELVGDAQIDVFDNCGPDPVHVEPSIAALQAGKHVICEKPMAIRVEDARRMRDAAAAAAGKSMCTFNYRFMPAVRLAKDLIAAGRIGTIYQIRIHYLQMAGHDPALPPNKVWYASWPYSGALQGIGSHAIDQCRYLVGEIKSVSALVRTFNKDRAITSDGCPAEIVADEGTAAVLDFQNGAIGVLESSVVATGRKNYLGWEINGSHGSLRWDLEHLNSLYACLSDNRGDDSLLGFTEINVTESNHPYVGAWWPSGHNIGWEHGQIIEKFHFLDAVANQKPLSPHNATFEDGYRTAVIIDAMRQSSRTGERIPIQFG